MKTRYLKVRNWRGRFVAYNIQIKYVDNFYIINLLILRCILFLISVVSVSIDKQLLEKWHYTDVLYGISFVSKCWFTSVLDWKGILQSDQIVLHYHKLLFCQLTFCFNQIKSLVDFNI